MAPVLAGMVDYVELKGTRIDLADIARMNDALDVRAENETRARKAFEAKLRAEAGK